MTRNLATDVANSTSGAWQLMASSARAPSSTRYIWRDQMLSTLRLVFLNRLVASRLPLPRLRNDDTRKLWNARRDSYEKFKNCEESFLPDEMFWPDNIPLVLTLIAPFRFTKISTKI